MKLTDEEVKLFRFISNSSTIDKTLPFFSFSFHLYIMTWPHALLCICNSKYVNLTVSMSCPATQSLKYSRRLVVEIVYEWFGSTKFWHTWNGYFSLVNLSYDRCQKTSVGVVIIEFYMFPSQTNNKLNCKCPVQMSIKDWCAPASTATAASETLAAV